MRSLISVENCSDMGDSSDAISIDCTAIGTKISRAMNCLQNYE
jgi:hypothetical protein